MKQIKAHGRIFEQDTKPLNCGFCKYSTGCFTFTCVSPACEITRECFGFENKGSWCPFGEIPKDLKQFYTVI